MLRLDGEALAIVVNISFVQWQQTAEEKNKHTKPWAEETKSRKETVLNKFEF